ncbi:mannosyl-oligosaccharide alpha-1,2-mannosidase IA-like, partial [Contarinia nasturtii]|uniref:mannosyl-oligosaccharide alpha-1,2-mannosidase IA-like n=1 Tax=Contarinia nasturtii TaxID=265458 RepID=UPI0012D43D55
MLLQNVLRISMRRALRKHGTVLMFVLIVMLTICWLMLDSMISHDKQIKISPRLQHHIVQNTNEIQIDTIEVDNGNVVPDVPKSHVHSDLHSIKVSKDHIEDFPNGEDRDPIARKRRLKIREMTLHAWTNYKKFAWGHNELRPLTKSGHNGVFGASELGATIIDSLDTLYIMNLKQQYQEARKWVAEHFTLQGKHVQMSVFETNIRFVGGLITMYAFTGDPMYKVKAKEVADKLLPAFETATGLPKSLVDIGTGISKNYGWSGGSILSEIGTLHLEFAYLSDITGDPIYRDRVLKINEFLREIPKPNGLYPNYIDPYSGKWGQQHIGLGAFGDSFYEYLLKALIQSNNTDTDARRMYDDAMDAVANNLIHTTSNGLVYVSDMKYGQAEDTMDHLACFSGGLFALSAATQTNENSERFMQIGKDITNTCHESYIRTTTHIGPERFRFNENFEAQAAPHDDKRYLL